MTAAGRNVANRSARLRDRSNRFAGTLVTAISGQSAAPVVRANTSWPSPRHAAARLNANFLIPSSGGGASRSPKTATRIGRTLPGYRAASR